MKSHDEPQCETLEDNTTSSETHCCSNSVFNHCVSNPPYQLDKTSEFNNSANNIFHLFYYYGDLVSKNNTMIFPGGRWIQKSTKGTKAADIIYPTVNTINWYPNDRNNREVFTNAILPDGVSVVQSGEHVDSHVLLNNVYVDRPIEDQILPLTNTGSSVISKLQSKYSSFVIDRKKPRMFFKLPSYYVSRNPDMVSKEPCEGTIKAYLANDGSGSAKRVEEYYISKEILDNNEEYLDYYKSFKVCVSQANAAKLPGTSPYFVVENNCIVGETWLMVGKFDTRIEAENYSNYLMSKTCRFLLEESKGGKIKTWGYFAPDLGNYTNNNLYIDWNKPIDLQLYQLFNLTPTEINHIENHF